MSTYFINTEFGLEITKSLIIKTPWLENGRIVKVSKYYIIEDELYQQNMQLLTAHEQNNNLI